MAIIGNDNQKPTLMSAASRMRPQGWLSGNMAQIMVLLNGLILTFTAFATLNVFITQIVEEGIVSVMYETREHLSDRFSDLEKGIQTAAASTSFSGKLEPDDIIKNFNNVFSYGDYFKDVFWLEQTGDGQYVAHRLLIPKGDAAASGAEQNEQDLHKMVVHAVANTDGQTVLISEFQGFVSKQGESDYPMLLAKKIALPNGRADIVYGVTNVSNIIAPNFFEFRKNIEEISVAFGEKNMGIYKYLRRDVDPDAPAPKLLFVNQSTLPFADKSVEINLKVGSTDHEMFLKKIPLLMMLFGITLTLIGTLYVRNNQKQALRLGEMNEELAKKNDKLNFEIMEREKLNNAIRKQEKENRAVIDAVSDIIFETDTDGKILFLNDTWLKITGFAPDRSLGRNLFDLLYMPDQAEQRSNLAQLVKGKKTAYRAFTRLRTADGNFRAVELAVSMLRQDENKQLRVVGTITDVEERRRAERALSEAEKKYRAIVENAASGIYQVTPEGVYLSANPAMARILNYNTPEEILRDVKNANTDIYFNPRERERSQRDAVRNGSINIECEVRRKDGAVIWVQENLRAVKDDEDQLIFFEGSMEDITQRKATEIALREAKIQSDLAYRAKSEFLANMSHELRTPLNAIIGFSEIIRDQVFGKVGAAEYMDYARDIHESGKRLLQVINDILDVSRIEAGERQLNEGVVDLNKVVNSALEMMGPKIEMQKTVISNYVTTQTPKMIGEAHAVKQMIMNLLSNAVKFTPEGGRVSIHADVDEDGQMRVSVTDTGIGLTDDEIEKALSPFGQVDTSLDKNESGTGLGLTLVQSLMDLHGGTFELFSQKGVGTTATLIFPAKRVTMVEAREPVTV